MQDKNPLSTFGPDLNEFSRDVNFVTLAKNSDFIYLRASGSGTGKLRIDKKFLEFAKECRRLGIPCGAYHFAKPSKDLDSAVIQADQFIDVNKSLLRIPSKKQSEDKESRYFADDNEIKRINVQNALLKGFDFSVYQRELSRYKKPVVLDIGSGDGTLIVDRVSSVSDDYLIIAVDKDEEVLKRGREKYSDKNIVFEQVNITDKQLANTLQTILEKYKVEKVDIINISMVLLHIKEKTILLRNLRKILKDDGVIIIKDIDDGINFAYPDQDGIFEKAWGMAKLDLTAGNRESGRRVYTVLSRSGFKNVALEKCELTTIGMTYDEKDSFFNMQTSWR